MQSTKTLDLGFAQFEIYDNVIVSIIAEGTEFKKEHLDIFHATFKNVFGDNKFVYISNRKNSYSVNPTFYVQYEELQNMIGYAVVCDTKSKYNAALFEKHFYKRPFEVFLQLNNALSWANKLLE
ncbi:hypothetical protein GCM10009117_01680 [Gangjinia marincola]|uniref:STAS/SEC14 domain-containing protein n=1 Tax=Gangjinia marincola TaxID=578463 RepID=A0ABP3XRS6_9FLAO